ncbi:hypothetical protein J15TS10_24120 [Paenibacillus woosongensis]|uniref:Uncharacterized protein n=1 Tax=Paenibacillus woosongensis TaxID=307580 RepID=A0ABQ4MRP2_9BACL|nr:hypothetical protein J15TS10_24120 [Paenibacillus woosongensis]
MYVILVTKSAIYYDNSANSGAPDVHCEQLSKSPNLTFFERIRLNFDFWGGEVSGGQVFKCKYIT